MQGSQLPCNFLIELGEFRRGGQFRAKNFGEVKIFGVNYSDGRVILTFKIHKNLDWEEFKKFYNNNNYEKINMKVKLYQKYYIQYLFLDNKCNDYINATNIIYDEIEPTFNYFSKKIKAQK